jgi:SAM-dependent methyltransferase
MLTNIIDELGISRDELRSAIQEEYSAVAQSPEKGFHFHTGYPLAGILVYDKFWVDKVPPIAVESFAGTGKPFSLGDLKPGEHVLDIGSGAGFDSIIAAEMVGESGAVVGIDMTPAMVKKANKAKAQSELNWLEFHEAFAEDIPLPDEWADVIISNGVLNLMPDKPAVLKEMARVLKPDGRLQIADIMVERPVPPGAKRNIDLWTG